MEAPDEIDFDTPRRSNTRLRTLCELCSKPAHVLLTEYIKTGRRLCTGCARSQQAVQQALALFDEEEEATV